jgi:hypothetical protein
MEYLVTMTTHVPDGTGDEVVDDMRARESARAHELALERRLLRLWRPPLRPGGGARSGCSPLVTPTSSTRSSPRCRFRCGAPMR